jgi:hypothetical protein
MKVVKSVQWQNDIRELCKVDKAELGAVNGGFWNDPGCFPITIKDLMKPYDPTLRDPPYPPVCIPISPH